MEKVNLPEYFDGHKLKLSWFNDNVDQDLLVILQPFIEVDEDTIKALAAEAKKDDKKK